MWASSICRFITRLLLVHGRWSHKRNAEIVQYAFYKNLVYSLPNVYFGFASGVPFNRASCRPYMLYVKFAVPDVCGATSGFSAQPIFSTALMATFNIFW
jgi:Phospholipid-translocating P-type ATPase C-terminal